MRGQEAILRLRLHGIRPSAVFVHILTDREPYTRGLLDPEASLALGFAPEVEIGPDDPVGLLDLRFLRDVTAHVQGPDESRVRAVARRATEFDPTRIVACWGTGGPILWNRK